jgi:hypothetical protein
MLSFSDWLVVFYLFQIGFVVVDYKYSLRGLVPGSGDYRAKLSEVWMALGENNVAPLYCARCAHSLPTCITNS